MTTCLSSTLKVFDNLKRRSLIDLGKNFFNFYQERKFEAFTEKESRNIFKQLVRALSHIHKNGINHLDIKLDNIMIDPETHTVKLIDFGLCNFVTAENEGKFNYRVGSEEYWAPEMVSEKVEPFLLRAEI